MDDSSINIYDKSQTDALLSAKADASSVYTKAETDTALASKADASDVYTKAEMDTDLAAKANASDVYTKAEMDTDLAAKADASDVYTKAEMDTALASKADTSDVYTKAQTDTLLEGKEDSLPSMTGNAGKVLAVNSDATGKIWKSVGGAPTLSNITTSNINSIFDNLTLGEEIIISSMFTGSASSHDTYSGIYAIVQSVTSTNVILYASGTVLRSGQSSSQPCIALYWNKSTHVISYTSGSGSKTPYSITAAKIVR